ncbi:glycosyltransferase family 2 protein [Lutibacter sp. B1]|uniref:glycosyltransferase family 2 protein n=1 Tax=Lutibacter sp. B1 TaxID=2725996 RepID=UPI001456F644|nr:glycosyltransferase family 2 protein [Lutibacter sp. B1]NLP56624.1 glycosyltransferase family 2 protein [Lutibacter sp. B1]
MPALNEGQTIYKVLKSVPKTIKGFSSLELLVINDGSIDNTEEESLKSGATVINHNYNKGVGNAFQTALNYSLKVNTDILVSIDSDGQFDVNQIEEMISPIIKNEADFCIGNRFSNSKPEKMPKIKYWGNRQISRIVSFVGNSKIQDASCGFRSYSRDCLLNLNLQGSFTYTHETILDLVDKGYRVAQVPVNVKYFDDRVSRVADNLFKYAVNTSLIIFKCLKDYKPLQFFLSIALFVLLISFFMGGFVLIHWFKYGTITPYKSLGIIALSFCGMSLLLTILAFVADMLNRIRNNQEKMLYLIKKDYFERD